MGRQHRTYLSAARIFACRNCRIHLAAIDQMMSRQFQGQHGRAYLFLKVHNIDEGPAEDRTMTTGLHTVRDISCERCKTVLGWKYDKAYESTQKYKENCFILERNLLTEVETEHTDIESLDGHLEVFVGRDESPSSLDSVESRS